jgi:hypothetical protein
MINTYRASAVICMICFLSLAAGAEPATVTFLGWSDQHVTTQGEAEHLKPAIDAMNALAGTAYPQEIGGKVDRPAFVFGGGDITEWPTAAARDAYNELITKRLKIPAYDLVGNHDEGGKSPSETIKKWIVSRHGAVSYSLESGGVRFIAAHSQYNEELNNPAQPIHADAIAFIRAELAKIPKTQPTVVALHLCFDAITNREELATAFGESNVILVLGGHYHKATVNEYRGCRFVQLPSPQSTTQFTVIRLGPDRLVAIPYDYKLGKWVEDAKVKLDMPIKRP